MSVKLLASKKFLRLTSLAIYFFLICLQKVTKNLFEMGCYEVSLGDTIGVGTPGKVETPNYSCTYVNRSFRLYIDLSSPGSTRLLDLLKT